MRESKRWKLFRNLLILGSVLAAIKLIFVDYTLDEEYQIVMAYRRLKGDSLLGTMWEPHQTSSFVCSLFLRLFIALTGSTTGFVIFLRCCTTLIQGLMSFWIYRVLRGVTEREYAFLLSLCYFNIVPKIIQIPEFSNLQLWAFTAAVLSLAVFKSRQEEYTKGNLSWIILMGAAFSMEILAYPSDMILFPFFFIVLLGKRGRGRIAGALTFAGTCAVCGVVWLLRVLSQVTPEEFLRNIRYAVEFDATHEISGVRQEKLWAILEGLGTDVLLFGLALLVGTLVFLVMRRNCEDLCRSMPFSLGITVPTVIAAEVIQLVYWLVLQKGYEEPQVHLFSAAVLSIAAWRYGDDRKRRLIPCLGGGVLVLLSVLYLSDLSFFYAVPHALAGILAGVLVLIFALENAVGKQRSRGWILVLLFSLAFVSAFGKGFVLRAGKTETNTLLGIGGVMRKGPGAGIFTNYMQAYVNDCDYEDFEKYIEPGTNCLIVTNMVGTGGTLPYLFRDSEVSHFSIVDPTTYDEKLLTYWELYPEKEPEVIVVDCWYGTLMEASDSWIMQYIENDFGYNRVEDGRYVRFYFR